MLRSNVAAPYLKAGIPRPLIASVPGLPKTGVVSALGKARSLAEPKSRARAL